MTKQRRDTSRQSALTCWLLTTHYRFGAGPTQLLFHLPRQLVTGAGVSAGEVRRHAGQWDLCLDTATLTGRGGAGRLTIVTLCGSTSRTSAPGNISPLPPPRHTSDAMFSYVAGRSLGPADATCLGQDVRNKLLHGKTDETILYGKETGNENM